MNIGDDIITVSTILEVLWKIFWAQFYISYEKKVVALGFFNTKFPQKLFMEEASVYEILEDSDDEIR